MKQICRKCNKHLKLTRNWSEGLKKSKDYICLPCNRNKHNQLYLAQQEKRIANSRAQHQKDYKNESYVYGTKKWASNRIASHKYRDKKKGLKLCDLKSEDLLSIIQNPCTYCKCDSSEITLDRIDNSKGHTKDNIVPCCKLCNTARMASFTYEEMKLLGKTIAEIKQKRAA